MRPHQQSGLCEGNGDALIFCSRLVSFFYFSPGPALQVNLQWKATLSLPVELHLSFIEACVFGAQLDGHLFANVKQRKDAMGILETSPFCERVAGVDNALKERAKGDKYAVTVPEPDADAQDDFDASYLDTLKSADSITDPPASVVQEMQNLKSEPKQVVEKYVAECWNKIDTIVQLEVEPDSGVADFFRKRLVASPIQELRQKPKSGAGSEFYIMFVYDLKASGEASSNPRTRMPPLRENGGHVKDFLKGAIQANTEEFADDLGCHDLFVLCNGGKDGLSQKILLAGFTDTDGNPLAKSDRVLKVHLDEEGYFARFDKVRGFSFNLNEDYHCITKEPLDMPVRLGKHYPKRSNRNNTLGPVACPAFVPEHAHMQPWKIKKDIWSEKSKMSCRVGGPAPTAHEKTTRKGDTMEPVNFHQLPWKFWAEMIHSHNCQAVIDCTVGAGYVAEAAIHERVPYLGICQTTLHSNITRQYLFARVWKLMQEHGSDFYIPELHEALGQDMMVTVSI